MGKDKKYLCEWNKDEIKDNLNKVDTHRLTPMALAAEDHYII